VKAIFNIVTMFLLLLIGYMLIMTVSEIPPYGEMERPTNNYVSERYLELGYEETGGHNLVANIVVAYRGYDTLVEITVLFTAVVGIFLCLKSLAAPAHVIHSHSTEHEEISGHH
jgi:multicomponent Na+:H+ antiporter subunit B